MRRSISLATLFVFVLALGAPAASAQDYFGADFEAFTGLAPDQAIPLEEGEMGELRGGFLGFLFSVQLVGSVELDGALSGRLDVNIDFDGQSESWEFVSPPEESEAWEPPDVVGGSVGPSVLIHDAANETDFLVNSTIGEAFGGAKGVFQIIQSPGSENNLGQVINLHLIVLNGVEDFGAAQAQLGMILGL